MLLGPKRAILRRRHLEADRGRRSLLGHCATLHEAHGAALAVLEQRTNQAIEGGGRPAVAAGVQPLLADMMGAALDWVRA